MIGMKSQHCQSEMSKKSASWIKDLLILSVWYLIYFLFMLGSRHLSIPDEGRYPEIAREMLASGNWITPTINGVPFLDKPILYYWLELFSMKCFGVNPWSIRLPQALFGVIGCLFLYAFSRAFYSRSVGIMSSLILSVSLLYFFSAHYANMDLIVANFLWISFFFFLYAQRCVYPSYKRRFVMYLAYIIAAFAFLTKGLMGIVFPAMVIFIWLFLTRKWREILKLYLPSGLILFLLVIMPWFILVARENPQYLYYFFYYQQIHRFVGGNFNNQMGFWFYFVIVFAAFLPFSIMLLHRLIPGLKLIKKHLVKDDTTVLIQLWVIAIFIFFSIPHSKIVGYILPIIAPLALLIALSFHTMIIQGEIKKTTKIMHTIAGVLFLILAVGSLIYPLTQTKIQPILLYKSLIPAAIGALGVFVSLFFTLKNKLKWAIYLIIGSMIIFNGAVLTIIPLYDQKTSSILVNNIKAKVDPNTIIVAYNNYWEDLPVLLNRKVYIVYPWDQKSITQSDNWAREFYFGIRQYKESHHGKRPSYLITENEFKKFWFSTAEVFVFINQSQLQQFKNNYTNNKISFKIFGHYRDVLVIGKIKR